MRSTKCEILEFVMKPIINYFPTHLALGHAFCNRKQELKQLRYNIEGINPVLIMSPRRYGKTSLALNTFSKIKWPYAHVDFYKSLSEKDIERTILNGVGKLLGRLETTPKRLLMLASDFFASMHIRVGLEKAGLVLDFGRRERKPADSIIETLEKLHTVAVKKKTKVILFMDEFQSVRKITDNYSIEAALREVAQKSTHIAYVFSGSDRQLIQEIFSNKKRPFYKLCNLITLDRISEKDYTAYIQKVAQARWGKKLLDKILTRIFCITERHPYYINKLSSLLWSGSYPNEKILTEYWNDYVLENKPQIERELGLLSVNQQKILISIAQGGPTKELFGKEFVTRINISLSSISRALTALLEKDYIYIDKEGYHIILDPLLRDALIV
jgi:DNA-binding transcriptional ArsR family regulator